MNAQGGIRVSQSALGKSKNANPGKVVERGERIEVPELRVESGGFLASPQRFQCAFTILDPGRYNQALILVQLAREGQKAVTNLDFQFF